MILSGVLIGSYPEFLITEIDFFQLENVVQDEDPTKDS